MHHAFIHSARTKNFMVLSCLKSVGQNYRSTVLTDDRLVASDPFAGLAVIRLILRLASTRRARS